MILKDITFEITFESIVTVGYDRIVRWIVLWSLHAEWSDKDEPNFATACSQLRLRSIYLKV